ncbi:MAG: sulfatase [Bacteroidota bacterium]
MKPNIVLIVADDLGWRDLNCYGNKLVETPVLDKLASNGIRFTNAYSSCTVCSPTRAALMTGKNPVSVNITKVLPREDEVAEERKKEKQRPLLEPENNKYLELDEITIAEQMKKAGYITASIGKWHLGGEGHMPENQGFDVSKAGGDLGLPPSYYYPYTSDKPYKIPNLEVGTDSLYLTDRLTKEAVQFISGNHDKPFFLYLPYYSIHTPWEGRDDLVKKYEEKIKNNPDSIVRYAHYMAMIECLDQNVGKVLEALDNHGLNKNTLVIFTSDNGGLVSRTGNNIWGAHNYPLRGGKSNCYEGGIRVPAMIAWDGKIEGGQVSDEIIISSDFYPTICEITGVEIPKDLEGVSLTPFLLNGQPVKRETLFWHYPHYTKTKPVSVMRDGDFKLLKYYEDNRLELYNLKEDIGETNDLSIQMPEKTKELHEKLNLWLKNNDARLPLPNPEYKKNK